MSWSVDFLNVDVRAELEALPEDIQAHFLRHIAIDRVAEGLQKVREPYVKHLEGALWEMRLKGKRWDRSRRSTSLRRGRRVVVVRVFVKKTEKTPRHEIELALKRARGVK